MKKYAVRRDSTSTWIFLVDCWIFKRGEEPVVSNRKSDNLKSGHDDLVSWFPDPLIFTMMYEFLIEDPIVLTAS